MSRLHKRFLPASIFMAGLVAICTLGHAQSPRLNRRFPTPTCSAADSYSRTAQTSTDSRTTGRRPHGPSTLPGRHRSVQKSAHQ